MLGGSGAGAQGAGGHHFRPTRPTIASRLGWRGLLTWIALAAGLVAATAQTIVNPGLESGTFTSAGSFAGGTYQIFNTGTPSSWQRAIGVGDARWVNSTAAHGGSKYSYAFSTGNVIAASDACLQNTLTGLTVGNCYTVTVYAAEAGGSVNNPAGNPGVMTMEFQNGGNFEYGRFFLPNNPAWSDSALTTIPWAQYSYSFTAQTTSVNFWISANGYNGGTGYMVADDVAVTGTAGACSAVTYDYGDLSITGTTFNTTGAGNPVNAPRHQIGATGTLRLGSTIDAEANGQPSANADGDDLATGPDEDGVTFPTLTAGASATITVNVSGPSTGKLNAWIDWNNNGTFEAGNEVISTNVTMTGGAWNAPGANSVTFTVPAAAVKGTPLAARFRLSTANVGATNGTATNGEIEDYVVYVIGALDFGDLPDTGAGTGTGNYKTLDSDGGPKHTLLNSLKLGATVDAEANGVSSTLATGDDTAGIDDEDGVAIGSVTFVRGQTAIVPVTVSKVLGGTAKLNAFFDFNNNGNFADSGETMTELTVLIPLSGSVTLNLSVPVPSGATIGANLGARFRISTSGGLTATSGLAADGEVEDYVFQVLAAQDLGDLPDTGAGTGTGNYRTLASDNGARHTIVAGLNLGATAPDADTGLLQNAAATADDTTNSGATDDEDGIASFPTFVAGQSATITVSVNNPSGGIGAATLYGFIDWNNDGDFGDIGEAVSVAVPDNTVGNVSLVFNVPAAAVTGANLGARFRITTDTLTVGDAGSQGLASNGEVEDYVVQVLAAQDLGDLPDTGAGTGTGNYRTLASDNGARHTIVAGLNLGATAPDADTGLLQNAAATADDTTNSGAADDEDGVASFPTFFAGQSATVTVSVNNPAGGIGAATLYGFIDWNNDGDFGDTGEAVSVAVPDNHVGNVGLVFNVPAAAVTGVNLGARFRITTDTLTVGDAGSQGLASNGEVEDYVVTVTALDYGDLPDTGAGTSANNYETLQASGGPRHALINTLKLGTTVDAETGSNQGAGATLDDTTNTGSGDDEDGVNFTGVTFTAGQTATLPVTVTLTGGGTVKLDAFFDWNNDGDFADTGEALTELSVVVPGGGSTTVNLSVPVPVGATVGASHGARFRISTAGGLTSVGLAADGEVEDYVVTVATGQDFGDLPDTAAGTGAGNYETLLANGGPRHTLSNTLKLGTTVDADSGLLQGAGATLDDTTNTGSADDEDGVTIPTLIAGQTVTVVVNASGTGKVNAFFDWNGDGDFLDAGEALTELSVVAGNNNLSVPVPAGATTGTSLGARFRISTAGGLTSVGLAADGEVEDYVVTVNPQMRLGNRVWLDNGAGGGTPNDGIINGTEAGINGVTVQIFAADAAGNPTGSVLQTTTTANNGSSVPGYYAFNVAPGDYVVVIPAAGNFVSGGQPLFGLFSSGTAPTVCCNGIDPDTTPTDSDDNGFNAINPAGTGVRSAAVTLAVGTEPTGETDLGSGDSAYTDNNANLTVDFGFVSTAPTAVKLGYVKGWWAGGQVTVEWETVSELNTLGFDLYRLDGGDRIRVNADLVAALNVERGGVYRVTEAMGKPTGPLKYLLVELETTGKQIEYGPFTVAVQSGAPVSSVDFKGGALEFRFSGDPGATYQVESTEDMVHGRWTPVGTATADADGVLLFRQPIGGSEPVRFYRALKP